jgi:hypothetical protein
VFIEGEEYLTTKQASGRYHWSKNWFELRRKLGDGPAYVKIFKRFYYKASTLEQWFKEQLQERVE